MPTRMPTLAAIRRTYQDEPAMEGQTRLLFVRDGGRIGLVQTASETADNADQFLARYLADMITDVAAPVVVVAISRDAGRPTHSDRQLWVMLSERLAPTTTTMLDLIAIGPSRAWSVRRARPLNQPRRRSQQSAGRPSAGRKSPSRAAAR
jgi:hypothetical protein